MVASNRGHPECEDRFPPPAWWCIRQVFCRRLLDARRTAGPAVPRTSAEPRAPDGGSAGPAEGQLREERPGRPDPGLRWGLERQTDRGREGLLTLASPPSEPGKQFFRTRLSG